MLSLAASACLGLLSCSADQPQGVIRIDDSMFQPPIDGIYGSEEWTGTIVIGDDRTELAMVEVTSKGNGHLTICSQMFRVYDSHGDLDLFDPSCLDITFVDLNNDGYRDLVLHGEIVESDDEEVFIRRVPVLQVYRFDDNLARFELMPSLQPGAIQAPSMLWD